jgi:hypothetical protein
MDMDTEPGLGAVVGGLWSAVVAIPSANRVWAR